MARNNKVIQKVILKSKDKSVEFSSDNFEFSLQNTLSTLKNNKNIYRMNDQELVNFHLKYHNRLVRLVYHGVEKIGVLLDDIPYQKKRHNAYMAFIPQDDFSAWRIAYNDKNEAAKEFILIVIDLNHIDSIELIPETKLDKLKRITDPRPSGAIDDIKWRIENRYWIREVQKIAFKILDRMRDLGWDKVRLAEETDLAPEVIQGILSGNRNILLSELVKITTALDLSLSFLINPLEQ